MDSLTVKSLALAPHLQKIRDWVAANLTTAEMEIMERHIGFLQTSGAMEQVLKKGDTAPAFQLKNQRGEVISSADLLAKGPLVVSFYRGRWCPYCVEEVKMLNNVYPQIRETGADLVVISPQSFARTQK